MDPEKNPPRKKRYDGKLNKPWIIARKSIQYTILVIFILLFIASRRLNWCSSLVNLPMRLDPLLVINHVISSRTFLVGSSLVLITLIVTILFGRVWCGWLCPLGTILDLFSRKPGKIDEQAVRRKYERWRTVKYVLLVVIIFSALFQNQTLLILDPLTLLYRTMTISIWPALDQMITASEIAIYRWPFLSSAISTIDSWLRPNILPTEPDYYRTPVLIWMIFLGVIILNRVVTRFWCRYLCPLGGLLGLISRIAIFRRQVDEGCQGCGLCNQACPTGTIDLENNYISDPAECTMCLDCLEVCPRSFIQINPIFSLAESHTYDIGRRQALATFGFTLASLAVLHREAISKTSHPHLIRPPGAQGEDFTSLCIRCAACMRACPTSALQPAVSEGGLEGLWTPIIIPRLGYCDYSCNACGQICPVQAIKPLDLDEKRSQVIGKATIFRDRCIAWSEQRECIVCEEMCPVPNKAIYLEMMTVKDKQGQSITIQVPHVDKELCIGCGICENKCPVLGEAAIRVFVPSTE